MVLRGSISKCQHTASVGLQFPNIDIHRLYSVVPANACRRGLLNVAVIARRGPLSTARCCNLVKLLGPAHFKELFRVQGYGLLGYICQ